MGRRRRHTPFGRAAERTLTSIDGDGPGGAREKGAAIPPGPVPADPARRGCATLPAGGHGDGPADDHPFPERARLWHVVLNVAGERAPLAGVRSGLERLADDHPFLLTARYAADRAEIRYWEQARDLHDAAAVALRLWGEHRATARLPAWEIVGLEVVDRTTYRKRVAEGYGGPAALPVGVHPY